MSLPMVSPADEAEAQRLRQELHEKAEMAEHATPSPIQGPRRELPELRRRLARLNARPAAVEKELTKLQASELWRLFQQWKQRRSRGEDLLEKLAAKFRQQIERERATPTS